MNTKIPDSSGLLFVLILVIAASHLSPAVAEEPIRAPDVSIVEFGAIGDERTLNTKFIQNGIDQLWARGGGTLLIPRGVFLSGALFFKPGVNLQLDEGAVLRGSTEIRDYPKMKTRIEGQIVDWIPALVNADKCDHMRLTGPGTLDGNGLFFWTAFWNARQADPQTTNLSVERPRLAFIQNSTDVQVSGVRFQDSGFWNLHLYRCTDVTIENSIFNAPGGKMPNRAPSSDGIDIDSCQRVMVRGCTLAVNDDCIALKGTKGPFAMDDKESPPVEDIRMIDCTFKAGHAALTLGSEATVVRNVVVENCRVTGKMPLLNLKLRPDTTQHYEDIRVENVALEGAREILQVKPWAQFFDRKGQAPPKSIVRNVTITDIKGSCDSLGTIEFNPDEVVMREMNFTNIDVQLKNQKFDFHKIEGLKVENVTINGKPVPSMSTK